MWTNLWFLADIITFIKEILYPLSANPKNGKRHYNNSPVAVAVADDAVADKLNVFDHFMGLTLTKGLIENIIFEQCLTPSFLIRP